MTPRARTLAAASCASLALQWLCAAALGGRLHPDEVHQYLEPAHRMVWGYGARSHEWFRGMRNLAGPSLVAAPMALARALGVDDPRAHLALVHALFAALSLAAVACAYDLALARRDERAARVAAWSLALWLPWDNLAFRTLGEPLSTLAVMLALRALVARGAPDVRVARADAFLRALGPEERVFVVLDLADVWRRLGARAALAEALAEMTS